MKPSPFWLPWELQAREDFGHPRTKTGDMPRPWRLTQYRNRVFVFEADGQKIRF